jgi:diguanylate cyclase (GGDEF)-like protein/PAS domain S-box-containing protein
LRVPLTNRVATGPWIAVAVLTALVVGGWAFIQTVSGVGTQFEQKNLTSMATIAASSFEPDTVRSLKGNKEDISSPVLAAVRNKLKRIKRQLPEARFVYLMGRRDGVVFFLADAEEPTSPDYSPPGQTYPEASPILNHVFSATEPMLETPYRDRWGEWVSSLAPVIDPATGGTLAVFGFDVPASHWRDELYRLDLIAGIVVALFATIGGGWLVTQMRSQRRIAALNVQLQAEVDELAKANRIVENSSTVLFRMTADASWPLSYISRNIERYGYSSAALLGSASNWLDLFHPGDAPSIRDHLEDLKSGKADTIRAERRFKKGDNSWAWVTDFVNAVRDETGHLVALEGIMSDITQTKNAEERIVHLANHDSLTGLFNRAAFMARLKLAFADARRKGHSFAVLYLDIDHFKDINDAYGHKNGDLFLQMIAERLSAAVRETDALGRFSVARFGGDEFEILETDVTDPSDAATLAQRLIKTLAEPFTLDGKDVHATVSIGISLCDRAVGEANDLLVQADLALYRSKESGRDQFHFYSADMDTKVRERVTIGTELYAALENGELELYYQPQVEVPSGKITGVEALVRWNHPTRGMVPPDQFISIAEKNGLIVALGAWVIQEACRQTQRWRADGLVLPMMGVNVSGVQFRNPTHLLSVVENALRGCDMGAGALEIELTESVLIEATEAQSDILDRLRQLGVRLALDDFGTGYSSLEYLHAYPIDRIKIAQQFMRNIPKNTGDAAIVKATIALAEALNLEMIAEGVETREQLDFLSKAGCQNIQGYFFSRPVPAKMMAQYLRRKKFDVPVVERDGGQMNVPGGALPSLAVSGPVISSRA